MPRVWISVLVALGVILLLAAITLPGLAMT